MTLNEKRLDDTIINRSQNIHAKQFPNIGGWQDIFAVSTNTYFQGAPNPRKGVHIC